MIIPALPNAAQLEVLAHQRTKKLAVYRIVSAVEDAVCRNCMDEGVVYVSFLGAGPTKAPITTKVPSTWVEHGWYVIENTKAYPCPHCQKAA